MAILDLSGNISDLDGAEWPNLLPVNRMLSFEEKNTNHVIEYKEIPITAAYESRMLHSVCNLCCLLIAADDESLSSFGRSPCTIGLDIRSH